jgi:hypothetical protein
MTINITIRNVPVETRNRLAEYARNQGQSMQEYLLGELKDLAAKPTVKEWVDRARRRAIKAGSRVTSKDIVDSIRGDRGR